MKFNKQLYPHIDFSDLDDESAMKYRVSAYEEIVDPSRIGLSLPSSWRLLMLAKYLGWDGYDGGFRDEKHRDNVVKKWLRGYRKKNRPKFLKMTSDTEHLAKLLSNPPDAVAQLRQQKKPKPKSKPKPQPKPKKQRKKPVPKSVQEFGNALDYPFLYVQLIQVTVSIYKSKVRQIAAGKRKPTRHPRTLLREAYDTAKNRLSVEEKYLTDEGFPTLAGVVRGIQLLQKDANLGLGGPKYTKMDSAGMRKVLSRGERGTLGAQEFPWPNDLRRCPGRLCGLQLRKSQGAVRSQAEKGR